MNNRSVRAITLTASTITATLAFALPAGAQTIAVHPSQDGRTVNVTTRCSQSSPAALGESYYRMPEIARAMHAAGTSLVRVDLDAGGRLTAAATAASSGNRWLDAAALESARLSTYRAEIRDCHAVAGSYLISVGFSDDTPR